jgi:hypothetical protein
MMHSFSSCLSGDPTNLPSPARDCRRAWCSGAVLPAARCVPASARAAGRRAVVAATAAQARVRALRSARRVAFGVVAAPARALRPQHWACATPLQGDAPSRRGFDPLPRSLQASASVPTAPWARAVRGAAQQRAVRRALQAARAQEPACERGSGAVSDAPKARRPAPPKYRVAVAPAMPAACRLAAAAAAKPALHHLPARSSAPDAPAAG